MVSDFLCAAQGRLHYIDRSQPVPEEVLPLKLPNTVVGKIMMAGEISKRWWSKSKRAMVIFNKAFPGDIAAPPFDNSSQNACKAKVLRKQNEPSHRRQVA